MRSEYVKFWAEGFIYERDKNGEKIPTIKSSRKATGVVKSGPELWGKIFRQCANLRSCDSVSVETYSIYI